MPDMDEDHKSGVERLEERLYSRASLKRRKVAPRHLKLKDYGLKSGWGDRTAVIEEGSRRGMQRSFISESQRSSPVLKIFLIIAVVFFLGAAALSAYLFFGGTRIVSPGNVDITVTGPTTVDAGSEVPLQITITNTNVATLRHTDLLIEYPEGTRSPENKNEPLARFRESLGDVAPGASVQRIVRAVFLGEEGQRKKITTTIEYRIEGSNAIFFREQPFEIAIGASPVSLTVATIRETAAGQEIEMVAELTSNSATLLRGVLVSVSYPPGFTFVDASPQPTFDTNVWRIGDFPPAGKHVINLRGTLVGENDTERVFRFVAGLAREDDEKEIGVPLSQTLSSVVVKRPFLGAVIRVNGARVAERHAVGSGERQSVSIRWINNLPVTVRDVQIRASIRGQAFDPASVAVPNGFYQSTDHSIVWDRRTNPELVSVEPGKSGEVSFSFLSLGPLSGANLSLRNPEIPITVDIDGERISERDVPERIVSSVATVLRVTSDVTLGTRATHTSGPFENSGSMPPKANQETTYTVSWSVKNTTNDLAAVTVVGALPPGVRFLGLVSPSGEIVSFNPASGEVSWDVGAVKAGTGHGLGSREIAFQIGLTASITQIGTEPELVKDMRIRGTDRFTGRAVSNSASSLTTAVREDPGFREGDERVAQ